MAPDDNLITGAVGTTSAYEGSDVSTGSQTPESVTGYNDNMNSGIGGGASGDGDDSGNDNVNTRQ
jgi:hypothetical protein